MEIGDEPTTCKSFGVGLPTGKRQETAVFSKEQIAIEAEAISRLRDKTVRMRSKRIFALAMASSS